MRDAVAQCDQIWTKFRVRKRQRAVKQVQDEEGNRSGICYLGMLRIDNHIGSHVVPRVIVLAGITLLGVIWGNTTLRMKRNMKRWEKEGYDLSDWG